MYSTMDRGATLSSDLGMILRSTRSLACESGIFSSLSLAHGPSDRYQRVAFRNVAHPVERASLIGRRQESRYEAHERVKEAADDAAPRRWVVCHSLQLECFTQEGLTYSTGKC